MVEYECAGSRTVAHTVRQYWSMPTKPPLELQDDHVSLTNPARLGPSFVPEPSVIIPCSAEAAVRVGG
jgi:hypothetical protein